MKRRGFIQTLFAGLGVAMLPRVEQPETPVKPVKTKAVTVQGEKFSESFFAESGPTGNYKFEDPVIWVNGEPVPFDKDATAEEIADAINKKRCLPVAAQVDKNGVLVLTNKMDKSSG